MPRIMLLLELGVPVEFYRCVACGLQASAEPIDLHRIQPPFDQPREDEGAWRATSWRPPAGWLVWDFPPGQLAACADCLPSVQRILLEVPDFIRSKIPVGVGG